MKTIEVFRTNVMVVQQGELVIAHLQDKFPAYTANFDLDDCDRILRLETGSHIIDKELVIREMNLLGYDAEVLPD